MESKKDNIGTEELEKRIMDLLVMLYSDQTRVEYMYLFIGQAENVKDKKEKTKCTQIKQN